MKGGVVSKIDHAESIRDQVYRILSHPDTVFQYISRGTYGEVFKVTYSGTDSGFEGEEAAEKPKVHVKEFILKVQGIDMRLKHVSEPEPNRSEEQYEKDGEFYPYSRKIKWDELCEEVELQQHIYTCALKKTLMPPCPAILFYDGITAEQFETFTKGQLVYKDGYGRLEHVPPIKSRDFRAYRLGIIFMEYVHSEDLSIVPHERYAAKYQEIESKALRTYVTTLQCGVLQGDPKPQNFLLTEDDNVVLIDFGIARKLTKREVDELEPMMQEAEAGNCDNLRKKLTQMEPENYKCLHLLIFRPTIFKSGKRVYPTLAPAIHVSKDTADKYIKGVSKWTPTLPRRESLSAETIAEPALIQRRDMEAEDRIARAAAEQEELRLYSEEGKRRRFWGGKRHTKYVGTRKKVGTRRKV